MILGFAGKIGVGKSTTAEWFVKNKNFVILSYGTPIKKALVEFTGLPMINFTDPVLKETEIEGLPGITPRIMMQKLGTEYARDMIFSDFFLWRMRQEIEKYCHRNIIIDDVRFENEAELIRGLNGEIFHLEREFETITEQTAHISENLINQRQEDVVIDCLDSPETTAEFISTLI